MAPTPESGGGRHPPGCPDADPATHAWASLSDAAPAGSRGFVGVLRGGLSGAVTVPEDVGSGGVGWWRCVESGAQGRPHPPPAPTRRRRVYVGDGPAPGRIRRHRRHDSVGAGGRDPAVRIHRSRDDWLSRFLGCPWSRPCDGPAGPRWSQIGPKTPISGIRENPFPCRWEGVFLWSG